MPWPRQSGHIDAPWPHLPIGLVKQVTRYSPGVGRFIVVGGLLNCVARLVLCKLKWNLFVILVLVLHPFISIHILAI